jgi:tripartite-type tricarboxylate transporter receptor subunit TctC
MKRVMAALSALLVCFGCQAASAADTYPARNIQVIVPYSPGGALDTLARVISQGLGDELNQSVIVVNKSGGATITGGVFVAHSDPDGYTLLFGAAPLALNTALGMKQPYDPLKELAPISLVATNPALIAVAPSSPFKTLKDILDAAKSKDGVFYGTAGVGSSPHLLAEALRQEAHVNLTHTPFRGSADAMTAAMGGQIPMMVDLYIPAGASIQQGQLRGIVVAAKKRLAQLPDIPTTAEAGFPNIVSEGFFGMLAPLKTPPEIIARLHEAIVKVCAKPDIRKRLEELGYDVVASTPEEYTKYLNDQVARWTPVAKAAGIKMQ